MSKFSCCLPEGVVILYKCYVCFADNWYTLKFLKRSLLRCNPVGTFLIIFIFVTFVFRVKHELVRNCFLGCMMQLRKAGKDEAQGDVQSAKKSNTGAKFSTLEQNIVL